MGTCGTCKFWGDEDDAGKTFRPCMIVVFDEERFNRLEGSVAVNFGAEIRAIRMHKAVVEDGSGYHAALKTQTDFGCVLHVKR